MSLGAVDELAQVLETHKASAGACEHASAALGNIAVGSEARKQAVFERAMPQLAQVLETHKASAGACEQASAALINITWGNESRAQKLVECGAIPRLFTVLVTHKAHQGACVRASGVFWSFASVASLRAGIISAGVVPLLANVWKSHQGAKANAHGALNALGFNGDGSKKYVPNKPSVIH